MKRVLTRLISVILASSTLASGALSQLDPTLLSVPSSTTQGPTVVQVTPPQEARLSSVSRITNSTMSEFLATMITPVTSTTGTMLLEIRLASGVTIVANPRPAAVPGIVAGFSSKVYSSTGNVIGFGSTQIDEFGRIKVLVPASAVPVTEQINYSLTRYLPQGIIEQFGISSLTGTVASFYKLGGFGEANNFDLSTPYCALSDIIIGPHGNPKIWVGTNPGVVHPPKGGDVNNDGIADWDYDYDTIIPGTGDVIVDVWIIDRSPVGAGGEDDIITVIGHDTNHNGHLEASEVSAKIGQCKFPVAANSFWIENNRYVHHLNYEPTTPGKVFHYIYDIVTGLLKIYDENGVVIWNGPPSGWSGFN